MNKTIAFYENPATGFRHVNSKEQRRLLARLVQIRGKKRHRAEEKSIRDVLVVCNMRLVAKMANSTFARGEMLEDLISEGSMGLMRALDTFDLEKASSFSTYATHWVRQVVNRYITEKALDIRIPERNYQAARRLKLLKEKRQVMGLSDELLTEEQEAKQANITPALLRLVRSSHVHIESGDERVRTGAHGVAKHTTLFDTLPCETTEDPVDVDEYREAHDRVMHAFECLSERQKDIIRRRYGLGGHDEQTLEEVAVVYTLSRERVRQLQELAMADLARYVRERTDTLQFAKNSRYGRTSDEWRLVEEKWIKIAEKRKSRSKASSSTTSRPVAKERGGRSKTPATSARASKKSAASAEAGGSTRKTNPMETVR